MRHIGGKREKKVNWFLERMARLAGGNVKEKKSLDRFCRWGSVPWLSFEIFATIIIPLEILEAKRRRKRARKKEGRRRRWYKEENIPLSRGFGGDMGDELILSAEWEIDLGNPAFPRVDSSTFLTEQSAWWFLLQGSSSRQPLGSAPFWKSEDFPSGRGGLTSTTIDKPE